MKVNFGKSKVMRCSRYRSGARMQVRLNGKQLEEVDCLEVVKGMWDTE